MNIKSLSTRCTLVTLTVLVVGGTGLVIAPEAQAAKAQIFDVDPGLQSRIAREKVKQRGPRRGSVARGNNKSSSDNCGQVDIGNNNGNNNARSRLNSRDNTVIVVGPVINAARCR